MTSTPASAGDSKVRLGKKVIATILSGKATEWTEPGGTAAISRQFEGQKKVAPCGVAATKTPPPGATATK